VGGDGETDWGDKDEEGIASVILDLIFWVGVIITDGVCADMDDGGNGTCLDDQESSKALFRLLETLEAVLPEKYACLQRREWW